MDVFTDARKALRWGMRWVNRQRSLVSVVRTGRQVLPGDSDFGDPMSTVGTSPARVLGRRAGALNQGRLSLLAETSLAGLQVADWLGEDLRGVAANDELTILFVDLSGYSQWALDAGDEVAVDMLRNADALITASVEAHEGQVVKRLGDGTMAIFPDCSRAVEAAFDAISEVHQLSADGFRPRLRAGVHAGEPQRIGDDFIGVDVNIAARLCEAASAGEVFISEAVRERSGEDGFRSEPSDARLRGVPESLSIYRALRGRTATSRSR
jgi:adenylate cyclase